MLNEDEFKREVEGRLEKYRNRSLFEQFSIYMGLAQILELNLKQLLNRRYGMEKDAIEYCSLGQVKELLKSRGLHPGFIALLEVVVRSRNHMAHNFLAEAFITREMFQGIETRYETRELEKGIYQLESLFVLFEWSEANDEWE